MLMTRQDQLLIILMEEAAEITQAASKALRFGLTDDMPHNPAGLTNIRCLYREFYDLQAVFGLVMKEAVEFNEVIRVEASPVALMASKRQRVEAYLTYSQDHARWGKDESYNLHKEIVELTAKLSQLEPEVTLGEFDRAYGEFVKGTRDRTIFTLILDHRKEKACSPTP